MRTPKRGVEARPTVVARRLAEDGRKGHECAEVHNGRMEIANGRPKKKPDCLASAKKGSHFQDILRLLGWG